MKIWDAAVLAEGRGDEPPVVGRLAFLEIDATGKRLRAVPRPEGGPFHFEGSAIVNMETGVVCEPGPFPADQGSCFAIHRRTSGAVTGDRVSPAELEVRVRQRLGAP